MLINHTVNMHYKNPYTCRTEPYVKAYAGTPPLHKNLDYFKKVKFGGTVKQNLTWTFLLYTLKYMYGTYMITYY